MNWAQILSHGFLSLFSRKIMNYGHWARPWHTETTFNTNDAIFLELLNYRLSQNVKLLEYDKFNHLTTYF